LEDKGRRFSQKLITTFEAAWCCNAISTSIFICGTLYPNMGEKNNRTVFGREVLNKLDQIEVTQPRIGGN
jgi:hypothetical protein